MRGVLSALNGAKERRIEAQQSEREAKLEHSRRVAEAEKLKECTFAPKLHPKPAADEASPPVVVRASDCPPVRLP